MNTFKVLDDCDVMNLELTFAISAENVECVFECLELFLFTSYMGVDDNLYATISKKMDATDFTLDKFINVCCHYTHRKEILIFFDAICQQLLDQSALNFLSRDIKQTLIEIFPPQARLHMMTKMIDHIYLGLQYAPEIKKCLGNFQCTMHNNYVINNATTKETIFGN